MCRHDYERLSERTDKKMIFCKKNVFNYDTEPLCIAQRFCPDKDKYVRTDQHSHCKFFKK